MIELVDALNKHKKEKENCSNNTALDILGLPLYAKVPDTKIRRHMQRYLSQPQKRQEENEE